MQSVDISRSSAQTMYFDEIVYGISSLWIKMYNFKRTSTLTWVYSGNKNHCSNRNWLTDIIHDCFYENTPHLLQLRIPQLFRFLKIKMYKLSWKKLKITDWFSSFLKDFDALLKWRTRMFCLSKYNQDISANELQHLKIFCYDL